ncbi:hypothetical protein D3C73_1039770 [compost metagenome]
MLLRLGQALDRGGVGGRLGQSFTRLGVGDLQGAVGCFVGGLGEFLRLCACIGHGFVGLLAGRQDRIEGVDRRVREARLHIDPRHLDAQPLPCRGQFSQALIDALHQIAAQPLTACSGLAVGTDQLGACHQDGVQVPRCRQGNRAASHQAVQRWQHMFTLEHERVRLGDLVEHPHIQLHNTCVTGEQVTRARQRITDRRGEGRGPVGLQRGIAAQQIGDPPFDHPIRRRQQNYLFERPRPRQQQAGILNAIQRTEVQHHCAILRIDLPHIGK